MITRLTAIVSGNVQRVGYRARVIDIANAFGFKGMIENQKDGLVKIIAEGDEEKLRWFESAIDIKNALIRVSSIEKEYSPATGDFENFGKLVLKGETDSRLDTAADYLRDLVVGVNNINDNLGGLGGKMDRMIDQQDQMLDKQDQMLDKQDQMLDKQDQMLDKQDQMLDKQDQMLDKQDATIEEIQALRADLKGYMDMRFKRIEADLAELKEMKVALKEKGLI
jgi:acylphosphatase